MIRYLSICTLMLGIGFGCVLAQDTALDDAEARARTIAQMSGYMKTQQFDSLALLMHPEAVNEFAEAMWLMVEYTRRERSPESAAALLEQWGLDPAITDYSDIAPRELFASAMSSQVTMNPQLQELLSGVEVEVIGEVPEGDTLRHVVTRSRVNYQGQSIWQMEIASFKKKADGGWGMLLQGEMKNTVAMVHQQFGTPEDSTETTENK